MIDINVLDFLRTGKFGPLALGMTREDVLDFLGPPDDYSVPRRRRRTSDILKWGDFEFYFSGAQDCLTTIFMDTFTGPSGTPQGGSRLRLETWVLREGLPRKEFEEQAKSAGLTLHQAEAGIQNQCHLQTGAGVRVGFLETADEYDPPVGLWSISYYQ